MLSYGEGDLVTYLHNAGRDGVEIARIIEMRRVGNSKGGDVLTEVMEHIHKLLERGV